MKTFLILFGLFLIICCICFFTGYEYGKGKSIDQHYVWCYKSFINQIDKAAAAGHVFYLKGLDRRFIPRNDLGVNIEKCQMKYSIAGLGDNTLQSGITPQTDKFR